MRREVDYGRKRLGAETLFYRKMKNSIELRSDLWRARTVVTATRYD